MGKHQALEISGNLPSGLSEILLERYREPHRRYHNVSHLAAVLAALEVLGADSDNQAVRLAAWFHDAVYDPQCSENEALSAQMALEALGDTEMAREVARLILLTKSHQPGEGPDDAWIIDIDLAIFAQPMERVREYERQIRAEYAWVPEAVYAEKRAEILAAFLCRPQLYLTAWARERFEARAREHVRALIDAM